MPVAHDDSRTGTHAAWGDEFVCAIADLDLPDVTRGFQLVVNDLSHDSVLVTIGVTSLVATDTLQSLITRTDEAMYAQRADR